MRFSPSAPHKLHSDLPSLPLCLSNSSFKPCVPNLNLNKSLVPASLKPCKYLLNSTLYPNLLYIANFTLLSSASSNFLHSLSLIHSSIYKPNMKLMNSLHSALSKRQDSKRSSITSLSTFTQFFIPLLAK